MGQVSIKVTVVITHHGQCLISMLALLVDVLLLVAEVCGLNLPHVMSLL